MGMKMITFIDGEGKVVFCNKLTSLPLKNESIIKKSIELFNDCEPCIIHRTFVMKKMFIEIEEFFEQVLIEGKTHLFWSQLPENISCALDFDCNAGVFLIDCHIAVPRNESHEPQQMNQ